MRLLHTFLLVASVLVLSAQVNINETENIPLDKTQPKFYIGLHSGLNSFNYSNQINQGTGSDWKEYSISFNPSFGFFLSSDIILGLTTEFNYHAYTTSSFSFTPKKYKYGVGGFFKKYFASGLYRPFVLVEISYTRSIAVDYAYESDLSPKTNILATTGGGGLSLMLGERSAIEFAVLFSLSKETVDNSDSKYRKYETIFNIGYSAFLGSR